MSCPRLLSWHPLNLMAHSLESAYPHGVLFSLCCTCATVILKARCHGQVWWYNPLVLELGSQSQTNLYEFRASLVYREISRTAMAIERDTVLKKKKSQVPRSLNVTLFGLHRGSGFQRGH